MLNFDKYREKIEKLDGYSLNCGLAELRGFDQDRCEKTDCGTCATDSLHWLVKKYEPPLLKNGDGLKPGDWIMVRYYTADKWHKRQFMCFYNGVFYTAEGLFDMVGHHTFSRWHDARLPEEGE